jgi:hypothetical protein
MLGFSPLAATPLADDARGVSAAEFALSGVGSVSAQAAAIFSADVSAAGSSSLSAEGLSTAVVTLSASGVASVSAQGNGIFTAVADIAGTSEALFANAGIAVANISGQSQLTGVSLSTASVTFSISGEGQFNAVSPVRVPVSGVSSLGEIGIAAVVATQSVVVPVVGVQAGAETNRVLVWGNEIPNPGTIWTEIAA